MLSILIPVYNVNVVELVSTLHSQCEDLDIPFEIVCIDDASSSVFQKSNQAGLSLLNIEYHILSKNIGRSRIRNKLIDVATFNTLLFIDSDHRIGYDQYLLTYIKWFKDSSWSMIYGGTTYPSKPSDSEMHLHWYYGTNREDISSKRRNQSPWAHAHTNNLLIRKDDLGDIRFDESILGYGYEDIDFAKCLAFSGKTILHINNPIIHMGLKPFTPFIADLQTASKNLAQLYTQSKFSETRLTRTYEKLGRWKLAQLYIHSMNILLPILKKTVHMFPSQLYMVDALRLFYFAQSIESQRKS